MFAYVGTTKTKDIRGRVTKVNAHLEGTGDNEAMVNIAGCMIPAQHAHIAARYHARTYFRPVPAPAMRPSGWYSDVRTSRMTKKAQRAMVKAAIAKLADSRFQR